MIICMLVMLEICIRVYSKSLRHHLPINQQSLSTSKDLIIDNHEKKFTDFQMEYFWRWTT
jgi:hypothetical protein